MQKRIILLLLLLGFIHCQKAEKLRPVAQTRIMMDTIVRIVVFDNSKSEDELQAIINRAFARMAQIDSLSNNYDESSQISYVNHHAYQKPIPVDTALAKIMEVAQQVSRKTNGKFDMTIGAIKRLWKFNSDHPQVPDSQLIEQKLDAVNYKLVTILDNHVKFQKSGVNLDLGGIAKGYAIDEAMRIIHKAGVKDAMVDAGGDLAITSSELTAGKRRVFIRHPRNQGEFVGYFQFDSGSVATSGDYERFFIQDSVRYHHILDPATGYPARKCVSVTVVTDNATIADALATAIFVMGPQQGITFAENLPNTEAMVIFQQGSKLNYTATDSLQKILNFSDNWQIIH